MIYQFKPESRLSSKLDAQAVGERLGHLEHLHKGLTAEAVVADAKSAKSPLHDGFEWDDTIAAQEHRITQARHIIRSIVIVQTEIKKSPVPQEAVVRAWTNIKQNDRPKYLSTIRVLTESDLRKQAVAQALKDAQAWKMKYQHLREFAKVFADIEEIASVVAA